MTIDTTPYANLDPHLILDAIDALGFSCSGSLFALNSYENRVYQVGIENAVPLIAKFYRPARWTDAAILEEHQFALELQEHDIPVVAPLVVKDKTLHEHNGYRFALFPRQSGRTIELDNMEQLEWVGRFIGRLHAVGACNSFSHRVTLNAKTYGQPYQYLIENNFIPAEMKQNFAVISAMALEKIEQAFSEVGAVRTIRIHGDCHAGNILWNNDGPHIVDLDDCLMGPAVQDLWMLIAASKQESRRQWNCILRGYETFNDFNYNEIHLVEALRTLRIMQYSAWLAKRWDDPAFPNSFPWFNTPRYWQEQLQLLNQQIALLDGLDDDE